MRREFMKRFWKYVIGIVPAYGLFPLVFSFVFNCLVYSGSRAIAGGWYHHNIEKFRKPTNRELVIIVAVVAVAVLLVLFYNEGWWKFNYLYKFSMERGGNL